MSNKEIANQFRKLFPSLTKGLSDQEVLEITYITGINSYRLRNAK
jgi:hypothetical protein